MKDYKETLNLPKTDFPMKADLAKREPGFLSFWDEIQLNRKLMEKNKDGASYILHDGPPYANGNIHIGTAFNKILKDFIPKYMWMKGYKSPYVPGWDTHGLPIEFQVLKTEGINKEDMNPVELRKKCTDYALRYLDIQREEFKRLGVLGYWDEPYITLDKKYEAAQIGVFADMVRKGYVYKGKKPVYWCSSCETALAAAEIEYWDESSHSIFVAFEVVEGRPGLFDYSDEIDRTSVVIWTTTPWTLPANMAVAAHPMLDYIAIRYGGEVYWIAESLRQPFEHVTGFTGGIVLAKAKGAVLEGILMRHPFIDRDVPMVMADYVLLDQGTGFVHTAPGHGVEDFETGIKYSLEIYNPLDEKGVFKSGTPYVAGMHYDKANQVVLDVLAKNKKLLAKGSIQHSYPHCWRCKKPVVFAATEQWFISVEKFRNEAIKAIDEVKWVPDWGVERIRGMVKERSDWCISRQRVWGVPIPAFYCESCGEVLLSYESVTSVKDIIKEEGSNCWWDKDADYFLKSAFACKKCGKKKFRKETDIMDVWFDSGVSHIAVLEERPELVWPADMYLEGTDQHRGWFQTSLLTSVAVRGSAPYKSVLTHGFIVDGEGRKMSKSLGNVIRPQEIIEKYGADVLRLWVASSDYRDDVRISDSIISQLVEAYRRIRNTARFLLGNLYDFDPQKDYVSYDKLCEVDRWLLSRLQYVIDRTNESYADFAFHQPFHMVHGFCSVELSAFYLDINKDRLYSELPDDSKRRSAQTVMYEVLYSLVRILAPMLSFTSEDIWQYMRSMFVDMPESVFLESMPELKKEWRDLNLEAKWDDVLGIKEIVSKKLEEARAQKIIGHSLGAKVVLTPGNEKTASILQSLGDEAWKELFIISQMDIENIAISEFTIETRKGVVLSCEVKKAEGAKCPRCWKYDTAINNAEEVCPRCARVLARL